MRKQLFLSTDVKHDNFFIHALMFLYFIFLIFLDTFVNVVIDCMVPLTQYQVHFLSHLKIICVQTVK